MELELIHSAHAGSESWHARKVRELSLLAAECATLSELCSHHSPLETHVRYSLREAEERWLAPLPSRCSVPHSPLSSSPLLCSVRPLLCCTAPKHTLYLKMPSRLPFGSFKICVLSINASRSEGRGEQTCPG